MYVWFVSLDFTLAYVNVQFFFYQNKINIFKASQFRKGTFSSFNIIKGLSVFIIFKEQIVRWTGRGSKTHRAIMCIKIL